MPGIERGYESGTRKGKGRGSASTSVRSIRVSGWTRESRATPARVTRTQCAKTSAEISVSAFHSCSQGVSFLELRSGNHRFYGDGTRDIYGTADARNRASSNAVTQRDTIK